jgi:hypothetical protein
MSDKENKETTITITNTNTGETKTFSLPRIAVSLNQQRPSESGVVADMVVPTVDLLSGEEINLGILFCRRQSDIDINWRFVGTYEKQDE